MIPQDIVTLLGYVLIALPGVILLIRDIVRNRGGVVERKDALTAAQSDAKIRFAENSKRLDELENTADAKQKDALIEVLAQLVAQGNTSQTITVQSMKLVDQTVAQLSLNQTLNAEWVKAFNEHTQTTIAQTAKIDKQTVAIDANTAAIAGLIPAEQTAVKDTIDTALKDARAENMSDLQAWVEGIQAQVRGPLEVVKDIPNRLITIDAQLAKLGSAVDVMPDKIAVPIVKELKSNAQQWAAASSQLAAVADKLSDWVNKQTVVEGKPS